MMNAPVRMVCGGCLRSVELSPGLSGEARNVVPIAAGTSTAGRITPRTRRVSASGSRGARRRVQRLGLDVGLDRNLEPGVAWLARTVPVAGTAR